jgi:hypothetical protein
LTVGIKINRDTKITAGARQIKINFLSALFLFIYLPLSPRKAVSYWNSPLLINIQNLL